MYNKISYLAAIFALIAFQSCSAIEGIFKAGMWWAFILVGLVIVAILWLLRKSK